MIATFATDGMVQGMAEVLMDSPEDVLMHRAFAGVLLQHREPAQVARGRFIEAQLSLEQAGRAAEDRKKLEAKQRTLLRQHGRFWLGALAPYLVDGLHLDAPKPGYRYEFQRGWLSKVVAPVLDAGFVRALAGATEARLLRELVFECAEPAGVEALAALAEAAFLPRLQRFWLAPEAGKTGREVVDALVAKMAAVRELRTPWHDAEQPGVAGAAV